ncbi:MAG: hypothetical protein AABO57_01910 [Acidobacteriota bacterium]
MSYHSVAGLVAPLHGLPLGCSGDEPSIRLKEPPLTVIAAMFEGEHSILMGADSESTSSALQLRFQLDKKIATHPSAPLAWGVAGNGTIADRLGEWLPGYRWPPKDLITFQDEVSHKACGIKQRAKERELNYQEAHRRMTMLAQR